MLDPNAALESCLCVCAKARSAPRNRLILGCDALGQVVNAGCRQDLGVTLRRAPPKPCPHL